MAERGDEESKKGARRDEDEKMGKGEGGRDAFIVSTTGKTRTA